MPEGTFPKAGGDPLYFSEANRFARAGGFIAFSSGTDSFSSGTAVQTLGSWLVGAGSMTNFGALYGTFFMSKAAADNVRLGISGIENNLTISAGASLSAAGMYCTFNVVAGSPGRDGYLTMICNAPGNNQTAVSCAGSSIRGLNTGSAFVIFLTGSFTGNTLLSMANIQMLRAGWN